MALGGSGSSSQHCSRAILIPEATNELRKRRRRSHDL